MGSQYVFLHLLTLVLSIQFYTGVLAQDDEAPKPPAEATTGDTRLGFKIGNPNADVEFGFNICFHGNTTVTSKTCGKKQLRDVEVNEEILVVTESGRKRFAPLCMFIVKDEVNKAHFLQIKTNTGRELLVTPNHALFKALGNYERTLVAAQDLKLGDGVLVADEAPSSVLRVERVSSVSTLVSTSVYSPLTMSGTLLAGGVLSSVYSKHLYVAPAPVLHLATWPLRHLVYSIYPPATQLGGVDTLRGIPTWLLYLEAWASS